MDFFSQWRREPTKLLTYARPTCFNEGSDICPCMVLERHLHVFGKVSRSKRGFESRSLVVADDASAPGGREGVGLEQNGVAKASVGRIVDDKSD